LPKQHGVPRGEGALAEIDIVPDGEGQLAEDEAERVVGDAEAGLVAWAFLTFQHLIGR